LVTRPSAAVLTMMSSNCSTSLRRPSVVTVSWKATFSGAGGSPTAPAATCTFCSRMALTTSLVVRSRAWSRSGSSQTRIEYSAAPKIVRSPTPGVRAITSLRRSVEKLRR
jgi:hypothetical protein